MQSMAVEALDVLQASLRSDDERVRLEAVKILFDRGYGKPTQAVDLRAKTDMGGAHLDALKARMQSPEGDEATSGATVLSVIEEDEAQTTR